MADKRVFKKDGLLEEFHNKKMDGFQFCREANKYFEQVKKSPNGVTKMRLRRERKLKKFAEEIIPLEFYIRRNYSIGLNLNVKWVDGDQNYDAILSATGIRVERNKFPKKRFLEVTNVVHQNDYLVRELISKNGAAFSAKGIFRDKKTGEIISKPIVYGGNQHVNEMAELVLIAIQKKSGKKYPRGTDLILQCKCDTIFLEEEWNLLCEIVQNKIPTNKFGKIVLMDVGSDYYNEIQKHRNGFW